MPNILAFFIFSFLAFSGNVLASSSADDSPLVEQLFLDLPVQDVLNESHWLPAVEPWASKYANAISDRRFGDAIWARYHIFGDVTNGIINGTNTTVLARIEEDAIEYRVGEPELYAEALSFYNTTSADDGRTDVLQLLVHIGREDAVDLKADLNKRTTYSLRCDTRDNLAYTSYCTRLLDTMPTSKIYVGDRRAVYVYGNCWLRIGPYKRSSDITLYAIHAVGQLIEEKCSIIPSCCDVKKVSGWSPKNSGHRKVCLSSKASGCSD